MAAQLKDTIPPHNEEAERAVLGAMLQDGQAITTAYDIVHADDFYSKANERVFRAILRLADHGRAADLITVCEELKKAGELDNSGGEAYVASLPSVTPTIANTDYYAGLVRDCALRRAMIITAAGMTASAHDESREAATLLDEAETELFALTDRRQGVRFRSGKEIIKELIPRIEERYKLTKEEKLSYTGVPSGFRDLDEKTSGFQKSELIIIAARPGMGKTALALTMAMNIAVTNNIPAAFFTLEMSDLELMQRLVSMKSGVHATKIKKGFLSEEELYRIQDAGGDIYDKPLFIVDMPNMKLLDLRSQARRLRAQQKVEIIFIDYMGQITLDNSGKYRPRWDEMSEISRSLKGLARELDIPIVSLCQVGREAERKTPILSQLRDSGSIEQDADIVMFLHRDRDDDKKAMATHSEEGLKTDLIIEKQRNGETGVIELYFKRQNTLFTALER